VKLERVRFVHGQRLRADDLSDAAGGELRRQQLHVVGAHGTWGIAEGLDVAGRATGARVREGAAFDRRGRALVLEAETAVLAGELVDAPTPVALVLCERDGCARLRFAADADLRLGDDIPLACFTPADGKLGPADLSCRRHVRSAARARVGSGVAHIDVDGKTWPATGFVDTSIAGFVRDPSYVITRVGGDDTGAGGADASGAFAWIEDPQPGGFTARLWAPTPPKDPFTLELDWLGAEPPPGCPPVPR
jgi:hypothetical protein